MTKFKNDAKAKRYYWFKMKSDFFDQKEIKLLRKIAGGDTYTIIYLKMLLKSLKNAGKLFYEFYGDNFAEEIALDIDESSEDVAMTLQYLETKGLIELVEQDEYFLRKVPELIGSESYSTERVRRYRERKALQGNAQMLQSNAVVTSCNEDIDIELEKDIDIELEKSNSNSNNKEKSEIKSIFEFWEQNGFGLLAPKTVQDFDYWIKDFEKIGATTTAAIELIIHALGIAVDNGVKKYAYVNTILKDWEQNGYLSVDQVKAENKKKNTVKDNRKWPDYSVSKQLENTGSSEYDNLGW